MADIFISYAHEDRPKAKAVADGLTAHGWSVWWDRKIQPGSSFEQVIEREVRDCKCAVVLWSTQSVESNWVRNEAGDARDRGILVPVLIENATLPMGFRHMQAADLVRWNGSRTNPEWESVLQRIAELAPLPAALPRSIGEQDRPSEHGPELSSPAPRKKRTLARGRVTRIELTAPPRASGEVAGNDAGDAAAPEAAGRDRSLRIAQSAVAAVLVVFWLVGVMTGATMGVFIHGLLLVAVLLVVFAVAPAGRARFVDNARGN